MSGFHLTKIEIMQLAYGLIGKTFISIDDLGSIGNWASNMYDIKIAALLQDDYWPFVNAQRKLNRLSETPLKGWKYAFQLPSDYLTANYVWETLDYYIYEDRVYCDLNEITLDYRTFPAYSAKFRADFIMYVVYDLALDYSLNSKVGKDYISYLTKQASEWRVKATAAAAKAQPNRSMRSRPMTSVRAAGGGRTPVIIEN
jgi:hypothetical protein